MVHLYYKHEQKRYYQNNPNRAPAFEPRHRSKDHQRSFISQRSEATQVSHGPAVASHGERKRWVVAEDESSANIILKSKFKFMSKNKILYSLNGFRKFRKTFGDVLLERLVTQGGQSSRTIKSWRSRKSYLHQFTA